MKRSDVDSLAGKQDGVVTRAQILALGAPPAWISRQVRAGRWQRVHRKVYVVHTGPLRWRTRARAALLYAGKGAVLSHQSAAFHRGMLRSPGSVIHVSIPAERRVAATPGIVLHRRRAVPMAWGGLRATSHVATLIDLANSADVTADDVVSLVCATIDCLVDPADIRREVDRQRYVRHRELLLDMLSPVNTGVESPLEYRYRRHVERAHGLPRAELQVRQIVDGRLIRADARYPRYRLRVELDGQLAHPNGATDADVWRDNAVLVQNEETTLRYRWRHVTVRRCAAARQVAAALTARGWAGALRPCGPECTALEPDRRVPSH